MLCNVGSQTNRSKSLLKFIIQKFNGQFECSETYACDTSFKQKAREIVAHFV